MAGLRFWRRAEPERKATGTDWSGIEKLLDLVTPSKAGVNVNVDTALKVSTVLACVRVIAEGIAQLPLKVYRQDGQGSKSAATDLEVYKVLVRRPNEWQTSFEFRECMTLHAALTGNAYAFINRVRGEVRELIPIVGAVTIKQDSKTYKVTYEVQDDRGVVGVYPRESIMHLRGPSWDALAGMDAVKLTREAIGLAIATEASHSKLFANGVRPGGILTMDGQASPEMRERLRAGLKESFQGVDNAFKTMFLDQGMKFTPIAMSGVDSQHIETRKHQIEEICRGFRVFPLMVGYSDKTSTFASAEQFFIAHVVHSLGPWIDRWQQVIERDLIGDDMDLVARFSVQGFMRGDAQSRSNYYSTGVVNGYFTRNDVRGWEDMNGLEGLDEPLIPLNMGTQAERDAVAAEVAATVKSMIGHNGGPDLDGLEQKIGRVLSARNEKRIRTASDELAKVLETLPAEGME